LDRVIVYSGQECLETDILGAQKNAFLALSALAATAIGSNQVLDGLACTPGSGLQVSVAAGSIYQLATMDATAYSTLGTDSHQVLKQGLSRDPVVLSCPAPGTAGQSINYLVQVAYQDVDTGMLALPYYNSANPTVIWTGPSNSGASQATVRAGACTVQIKAGTAAATGTQTTPSPDSGFVAAYVVTIANGASSVTSGNIAVAANAPFLGPNRIAQLGGVGFVPTLYRNANFNAVQGLGYFCDTSAGAFTATLPANLAYVTQPIPFADYSGTWLRNNLTIARNGNPIAGRASDLICNKNNASFQMLPVDGVQGWRPV
jgi:hypothetical protein